MKRRKFIRAGLGCGLALSTFPQIIQPQKLFGSPGEPAYELAAVRGGEPAQMFDEAIKVFGGIKNYVKKNQTVVIKPNIGWDVIPEKAANTNPELIGRIVEHCVEAGAKDVFVFDHTCDNWNRCYSNSGIEKAVKDAGGKMVSGANEGYYQKVEIPNGKKLNDAKVHELILDSDVFINVPVLKNHGSAKVTISMKNLMGVVWDRGYWHRNGLNQCIADFPTFRQPDLNIVDAYAVMKRNGPRGVSEADLVNLKTLIVSPDIVAADSAAAKMYGLEPNEVSYISMASELDLGKMDLDSVAIKKIKI